MEERIRPGFIHGNLDLIPRWIPLYVEVITYKIIPSVLQNHGAKIAKTKTTCIKVAVDQTEKCNNFLARGLNYFFLLLIIPVTIKRMLLYLGKVNSLLLDRWVTPGPLNAAA